MSILVNLRLERKMKATPPPLPVVRGLLMMVKPGGVRESKVEGRESGEGQVSHKARKSMSSSRRNSRSRAGLSIEGVTDDTEQALRLANSRVVGPGLISMSPARSRSKDNMKGCGFELIMILGCLKTIEKEIDEETWSRQGQTEDSGIGQ